jgi:hypothetical protein
VSGSHILDTGRLRLPASALLAVFLSCALTSAARADPGETSLRHAPFASEASPDATFAADQESMHAISIEVSANATEGEPLVVTVSGESETTSELFVYVIAQSGCQAEPAQNDGTELSSAGGEAVGVGGFEKSYSFTPGPVASYTVCAYVAESEDAIPEAAGTSSFANTTLQDIAEAQERATKAVSEEERAAKGKAEGEAAAAQELATREAQEAAATAAAEAAAKAAASTAAAEAAAKAAAGQAEAELRAVQAAKVKQARAKPVARLTVAAVAHNGDTTAHPGYTTINVTTSPYAFVDVELARGKRHTTRIEWGEHPAAVAQEIPWSCSSPGGTYRYTVTARTDVGKKLTRSGSFAPVSAVRCHTLQRREGSLNKHRQETARERSAHAFEEEVVRRDTLEREEQEREEDTCRQEGGTPTIVLLPGGPPWLCEGPRGGALRV